MNPPYLSGIESVQEKEILAIKIKALTGVKSKLHTGQIALEAIFLELVASYLSPGTIVSCILPIQHLTRKSKEVARFRKFLLEDFGLCSIVSYPMDGVFDDVIKETVILVGKIGQKSDSIEFVNYETAVANLDLRSLIQGKITSSRAVTVQSNSYSILERRVNPGVESFIGRWS